MLALDDLLGHAAADDEGGRRLGTRPRPRASAGWPDGCGTGCWPASRCAPNERGSHHRSLEFDVCGPLPPGVTVLEASAGTGKTYTIAALTARYVAEGVPLERLLLVTFTRIATGELRERVRERLVSVERGLGRRLAGAPAPMRGPGRDAARRRRRATRSSGVATASPARSPASTPPPSPPPTASARRCSAASASPATSSPTSTFVEDLADLRQRRGRRPLRPPVPPARDDAGRSAAPRRVQIARARSTTRARRSSADAPARSRRCAAGSPRRSAASSRRASARMAVMTYDDLLTRLRRRAARARRRRRAPRGCARRYEVVLVDEFQDTDPVQWEIMRRAFGDGGATLVLIGDPKQAIYAFRGADVYAYLEAAARPRPRGRRCRSTGARPGLIDAHDALFSGSSSATRASPTARCGPPTRTRRPASRGAVASPLGSAWRCARICRRRRGATRGNAGDARARRLRRGRRRRGAARAPAPEMAPRGRRATPGPSRSSPGTWLCWCAPTARRRWSAMRSRTRGARRDQRGGQRLRTEPAQEWLRTARGPRAAGVDTRAHSAALTAFLGGPRSPRRRRRGRPEWEEVHRRLHEWARVLRLRGWRRCWRP